MAVGYSSSKLTLHVGDGFEFMKQNEDAFDVIITDSSDPMGKRGMGLGPPWQPPSRGGGPASFLSWLLPPQASPGSAEADHAVARSSQVGFLEEGGALVLPH